MHAGPNRARGGAPLVSQSVSRGGQLNSHTPLSSRSLSLSLSSHFGHSPLSSLHPSSNAALLHMTPFFVLVVLLQAKMARMLGSRVNI